LTGDLLASAGGTTNWSERLGPGAMVLRGFAARQTENLATEI